MKTICGTQIAESTSPSCDAEPSRSSMTANASATGAKAVPSIEVVRPRKRSRKSRSSSGPSRLRSVTLFGPAPQPEIRLPERHSLLVGVGTLAQHHADLRLPLHLRRAGGGEVGPPGETA